MMPILKLYVKAEHHKIHSTSGMIQIVRYYSFLWVWKDSITMLTFKPFENANVCVFRVVWL